LKLEGFKQIQKQYSKEKKMAGSGKRRMKGKGFWSDVGNWFVGAGQTVNDFLKKTKLISNVAGAVLPLLAPIGTALLTANTLAAAASVGAAKAAAEGIKSLGYGSKSMHRMPDGSMMKGKMHGGELSNKLVINPVGQRLMGKGYGPQDVQYIVKAITGRGMAQRNDTFGMNGVQQKHAAPMKAGIMKTMKGNGPAQHYRLKAGPALNPKAMIGAGGIPYGSISSEFGNMRF
jgi:hypothetical protein